MPAQTHPYISTASNLFIASAFLGVIAHYLSNGQSVSVYHLSVMFLIILIIGGIGLFIRAGHLWLKWVLLPVVVISLYQRLMHLTFLLKKPLITQFLMGGIHLLQVSAVILLFLYTPKSSTTPL